MFNFLFNGNVFDRLFPENLFSFWFFGEQNFPSKKD